MQITDQRKGLSPDVLASLPDDATIIEHCRDGGVICREPIREQQKVPVLDEEGNQVTRAYETGQGTFHTPVWRWEDIEGTRKVKYEPRRTGMVMKNPHFQETAEERAERERRQRIEQFHDEFAELAVDAGVTVADLIQLVGDGGSISPAEAREAVAEAHEPEPAPERPASEFDGYELEMTRPGHWSMPDGSVWPEGGESANRTEAIEHIGEAYSPDLALQLLGEAEEDGA